MANIPTSRIVVEKEELENHYNNLIKMSTDKQRLTYLRKVNEDQLILLPLDVATSLMENSDTSVKNIASLDIRAYSEDIPGIINALRLLHSAKSCFSLLSILINANILLHLDKIIKTIMHAGFDVDSEEIDSFLTRILDYSEKTVIDYIPEIRVIASKTFMMMKRITPSMSVNAFRLLHFWESGIVVFDEEIVLEICINPEKYYAGNCDWLRRKCDALLVYHQRMREMIVTNEKKKSTVDSDCTEKRSEENDDDCSDTEKISLLLPPPAKKINKRSMTCVTCEESDREIAFIPCGHYICCFDCCQQILDAPIPVCPMCKKVIKNRLLILTK